MTDLNRPTDLYRMYDNRGALLYAGVSHRTLHRFAEHCKQPWWKDVATITVDHHPTRWSALDAESVAIHLEQARHNRRPEDHLGVAPLHAKQMCFSTLDIARCLGGVHHSSVRQAVVDGHLKPVFLGSHLRVHWGSISELLFGWWLHGVLTPTGLYPGTGITPTLSMVTAPVSSSFLGAVAFKGVGVHDTGRVNGEVHASTSADGGYEPSRTGALNP